MSKVFNDEEVHTLVTIPPDGGWGIVVVLSSFICHFVIDGNIYTYGLFLDCITEAFDRSMAETSLVGSALSGVCYLVGPFVSAMLNRFDFRCVSWLGCILAAGAYALSAISVNYEMYLAAQGIMLGVGYGMLYVPALVITSLYFARWRSIAVAFATCGTGAGTFVVPNIINRLLEIFGWRYTYFMMTGLVGLAAISSLAFIPLVPRRIISDFDEDVVLGTSRMNFKKDNRKCCTCCHWGNTYFPTATDVVSPKNAYLEDEEEASVSSQKRRATYTSYLSTASLRGPRHPFLSVASIQIERCHFCWFNFMLCMCCSCCQTESRPMYRDDIFYTGVIDELRSKSVKSETRIKRKLKRHQLKTEIEKKQKVDKRSAEKAAKAAAKRAAKLAEELRRDAEKAASTSKKKVEEEEDEEEEDYTKAYHMQVTRVTTERELYEDFQPCCSCTVSALRTLTTMLDFRIMKSIAFLILCCNGFFFTLGYNIPFMFIVDRAVESGIPRSTAAMYLSYMGASNILARVFSGILPVLMDCNNIVVISVCCAIQGALTAASGFYMENWCQIVYVCTYGFLSGPHLALRSVIVVDLFGVKNLTNIFGLQLMMCGIAAMIGPPMGGFLRDYTKNFDYSFYLSGGCIVLSALLMMIIKPIRNWETRTGFDEEIENFVVVPPDGGWGWVIVAAAFGCNLVTDGITYTFGIFLLELSKEFGVSVGRMTLNGSTQTFFYYLVGPFVSALLNRYGFRFVAVLGSLLGSSGYILGSFCKEFHIFLLCGGVITGIGFGMITIPTVIICGFYFEKWRALATGIATCSSGIGTLLTPPFVTFLIGRIGWRYTYRVLAGFVLLTGLLAMFYRPLQPIKVLQDEKEIQIIHDADSFGSIFLDSPTTKWSCCPCSCRRLHNINYPTTAEIVPIETVVFEIPERSESRSSYSFMTTGTVLTAYPSQNTTQVGNIESRVVTSTPPRKCLWCRKFCRTISCGHCCVTVSRPMYRDDIFFAHSLMLLPQYKDSMATQRVRKQKMRQTQTNSRGIAKTRSTGYHMSVTRVTTHREIYGDPDQSCCSCSLAMLRPLSTMLDINLLKSPAFLVFSWSGMFIVFGYLIPFLYIKDRAVASGISPSLAFWLLSAIGAANSVGRIISGVLPSLTNIKVIEYSYVCISIAGIMTILSGFWERIEFQFFYACVYGMAGSCIATLRPIIVVELFGLEHLTNAFGLQLMFMAFSGFMGTMVAGMVYDSTKDFNMPFYMSGGCLILAAFLLMTVKRIRQIEKKMKWCNI